MSRIKLFLLILILLSYVFSPVLKSASAITTSSGSCTLEIDPLVIPSGRDVLPPGTQIKARIGVQSTGVFDIYFARGGWFGYGQSVIKNLTPDTNGILGGSIQSINIHSGNQIFFKAGRHIIDIERQGIPGNYCSLPFDVLTEKESNQIICTLTTSNPTNEVTDVKINGTISPSGKYRFSVKNIKDSSPFNVTSGNITEQNLGKFNPGSYTISLQKDVAKFDSSTGSVNSFWETTNCNLSLAVRLEKDLKSPQASTSTGNAAGAVCTGSSCTSAGGEKCKDGSTGIQTAIGCIHTDPFTFIKDSFTFLLGIGGGIAFLFMLLGAFQMITSAGNPDSISAGKDRFTSAIIGLLFVIFSVLLLQIIGAGILKIPGFG